MNRMEWIWSGSPSLPPHLKRPPTLQGSRSAVPVTPRGGAAPPAADRPLARAARRQRRTRLRGGIGLRNGVRPLALRLAREGERLADFDLHRISPPYGSWFSSLEPAEQGSAPPDWKSALSVLVGLYPTVVLITIGLDKAWPGAGLWLSLLVGSALSVATLTWVVMPITTRLLRFWLAPSPLEDGPRRDALGAGVSIAFLTFAAALFWLFTTQIWTLP